MIDSILDVIFWIIKAVIGLLPSYTIPNNSMIGSLLNALGLFNQYFPVYEMAQCLIAYYAFVTVYMLVRPILKLGRLA